MKGVFVTATDTGVGKTHVAAALARALRNRRVGVFKPVACGGWEDTDALRRAAASGQSRTEVTPYFFRRPLAPAVDFLERPAKARAARTAVAHGWRRLKERFDAVVVEGAGGALVPLWGRRTVADLMEDFGLPVWVVARPGLGTLNHTLLTLEALRRRGIRVRRILVSGHRGRTAAERTNPALLRRWSGLPVTLLPWSVDRRRFERRLLAAWRTDAARPETA